MKVSRKINKKEKKEKNVKKLAKESGISVRIEYKEVSCATMEDMTDLEERIYRLALGHSYMGERIPKSCLIIEQVIEEMKEIVMIVVVFMLSCKIPNRKSQDDSLVVCCLLFCFLFVCWMACFLQMGI